MPKYFHLRLCFLPPPLGAGLDPQPRNLSPSREIRRDVPLPRKMDKSRQDSFTVCSDGFSQAEVVHILELASAAEVPKATAAFHAAWANWGIPRTRQDEIDVLGASGTLGRMSLPRTFVGQLIASSSWFCQDEPRTIVQGQLVGGRWVRAFQFRRELSSIGTGSTGMRARRRLLPDSMTDDVLLAISSVPVCVSDLRAKNSPLVVATDASEWELGSSRASTSTAEGRVALQELRQATPSCSGSVGLLELFTGVGGLRRAMERLWRMAAGKGVFEVSWPDVHLVDQVADRSHATLTRIVDKAPHVRIWIAGTSIPSDLLTAYREIQRLVSSLQQLVPDAQVAFLAECASNTDVDIRDSISRALNVNPIVLCPSSRCPRRRHRLYLAVVETVQSVTNLLSVPKEWIL